MVQNTLALIIVFSAAIISIFSVVKSVVSKKAAKCDGCAGCEFKRTNLFKPYNQAQRKDFESLRIASPKIEQINLPKKEIWKTVKILSL